MTSYLVVGHPLNAATLNLANPTPVHSAIQTAGVGVTVNLTLTGPDDTKVKAHGILQ